MLISIQYPFADARSFLADHGGRLVLPRWNAPDPESDFVRAFGGVAVRPQGGASIGGEQYRCEARWAVRFEAPGLGPDRRCAFRRFYADGEALAKFEIGIVRDAGSRPLAAAAQINAVHDQLARVPMPDAPACPLGELGPVLARAYLHASTAHRLSGACERWWIHEGTPLTLVMYRNEDQLELPAELTPVQTTRDHRSVTLAHWWQRSRRKLRPVWFLGYQPEDYALARQLRIDLVRLHCEYESLRIILRHIATCKLQPEPRSLCSDRLQHYLNQTISTITRLRSARRSVICETSCRLVERAVEEVHGNWTSSLLAELEAQLATLDVRPNVRRKVCAYAAEDSRLDAPVRPASTPADPAAAALAEAAVETAGSCKTIAFLAANPAGTSRPLLDKECAGIERELRMTAGRNLFAVQSKWAVTVDDMMRHLATLSPTVIHFSGQAQDVDVPDLGWIQLEDEQRQPHCVDGRALAQMISSAAPSARLIVLDGCFSDALAGALCRAVECVVGTHSAIDDAAAHSFAIAFYRALGNGSSVANAMWQAEATLAAKHPSSAHLAGCKTRDGTSAEHLILASLELCASGRRTTAPMLALEQR